MFEKTDGIAVRVSPFSRTSLVVTWLTPGHGKVATAIKGAVRPKSAFLGQVDLFYACEVVYYVRARNDLHIIKECSPLKQRAPLRRDWRACVCASYMCDVVTRATLSGSAAPDVYQLLDAVLDSLSVQGAALTVVFWFELRLLGALGLAPRLQRCLQCGRELVGLGRETRFSVARGGALCSGCAGRRPEDTVVLSPDVLAILSNWQGAEAPHVPRNTRCAPRQLREIGRMLGEFVRYHLDAALPSRTIALRMLRERERNRVAP